MHFNPVIPIVSTGPIFVALSFVQGDDPRFGDLVLRHVRLLRSCVALGQRRFGFSVEAAVVLPGEAHLLCGFDTGISCAAAALRLIRATFSAHVSEAEDLPADMQFWADVAMTEVPPSLLSAHRAAIETAPVRAGLAPRAEDWPYGSGHHPIAPGGPIGAALA